MIGVEQLIRALSIGGSLINNANGLINAPAGYQGMVPVYKYPGYFFWFNFSKYNKYNRHSVNNIWPVNNK